MEAREAFERFEHNFLEQGAMELARNAAVVAQASAKEARAAHAAMTIDRRIERHLKPIDVRLREQVKQREHDRDHANSDHLIYELSQVGLQLGIVLASVSIIARRRWLLYGGCGCGAAGAVLLVVGLLN